MISSLNCSRSVYSFDEIELLADRLEGFGELGVEQLDQGRLLGGPFAAQLLGHLEHVFRVFVDADEERHLDVGPDVVFADQAFAAVRKISIRLTLISISFEAMDHRETRASRRN